MPRRISRIRALLLGIFAPLGGLALFVTRSVANPETLRLIVPGVWFREGDLQQGHSNNVIIEMKDYMIVVRTPARRRSGRARSGSPSSRTLATAHPVVRDALPHFGEEENEEAGRVAKDLPLLPDGGHGGNSRLFVGVPITSLVAMLPVTESL